MTENEWTFSICEKLKDSLKSRKLFVETLRNIPYSQEILGYKKCNDEKECIADYLEPTSFETDLVVYEEKNGFIKPRVVVEAKIKSVTTHDAITYSYKAEKHKNITPYLRYGIMLGDRENYPLPGRLFRHGTNFDFMFSFVGMDPTQEEWKSFINLIVNEVKYSRIMEEMLHDSRKKDRKHYYMFEKKLVLKELSSK